MKSMQLAPPAYRKFIVAGRLLGSDACQCRRACSAQPGPWFCQSVVVKILCDSYDSIGATRSISYGSIAFYPREEAVMFGLLAVLAGFVLLCLFIAYECLCGRV